MNPIAGCKDAGQGKYLKEIMQTPYFRIVVVDDEVTVELCGALKVSHQMLKNLTDVIHLIQVQLCIFHGFHQQIKSDKSVDCFLALCMTFSMPAYYMLMYPLKCAPA